MQLDTLALSQSFGGIFHDKMKVIGASCKLFALLEDKNS